MINPLLRFSSYLGNLTEIPRLYPLKSHLDEVSSDQSKHSD